MKKLCIDCKSKLSKLDTFKFNLVCDNCNLRFCFIKKTLFSVSVMYDLSDIVYYCNTQTIDIFTILSDDQSASYSLTSHSMPFNKEISKNNLIDAYLKIKKANILK